MVKCQPLDLKQYDRMRSGFHPMGLCVVEFYGVPQKAVWFWRKGD